MDPLFADGIAGVFEAGVEAVNSLKLGGIGVGASAAMAIAVPLTKYFNKLQNKHVLAQIEILKSELANEKQKVVTAKDEGAIERQKQHGLEVANAALNQTCSAQAEALAQRDAAIARRDELITEAKAKTQKYYAIAQDLNSRKDRLQKAVNEERELVAELHQKVADAGGTNQELESELAKHKADLDKAENRMVKAAKLDGHLWQVKASQVVPPFLPQQKRNQSIVAVLNLKGGVGKTTVTANLGAAFAREGKRVLLVDLDLQGSLTSHMLPQTLINERFLSKRLLQDYFKVRADGGTPKFNDFICDVPLDAPIEGKLDLVPTTDQLGYAELNLNMNWLLRQGEQDVRFMLRAGLHDLQVSGNYDIVILDCPPIINVSCVNALAAADYLLIPAVQGKKALERVPRLVETVRAADFRQNVNDALQLLGVLANRTTSDSLPQDDSAEWEKQVDRINVRLKCGLKKLETVVPRMHEVQSSEAAFRVLVGKKNLNEKFDQLVKELHKDLHSASQLPEPPLPSPVNPFGVVWGKKGTA